MNTGAFAPVSARAPRADEPRGILGVADPGLTVDFRLHTSSRAGGSTCWSERSPQEPRQELERRGGHRGSFWPGGGTARRHSARLLDAGVRVAAAARADGEEPRRAQSTIPGGADAGAGHPDPLGCAGELCALGRGAREAPQPKGREQRLGQLSGSGGRTRRARQYGHQPFFRSLAVLAGILSALVFWYVAAFGLADARRLSVLSTCSTDVLARPDLRSEAMAAFPILSPFGAILDAVSTANFDDGEDEGSETGQAENPDSGPSAGVQILALLPLLYMSVATYRSLFKFKMVDLFHLQPRGSVATALVFNSTYLIRLQFP
eukprot:scaffold529_cov308-Pinguiococcus_pyrenoidosus.AAC.15